MRRLCDLGAATVQWDVFSLEIVNNPDGVDGADPMGAGSRGLRTAILVRDTHGNDAMGAFYAALGRRYFEELERYDQPETFHKALADVGLEPDLYERALRLKRTWTTLVSEHRRAVRRAGAFGVPVLRLDGGNGPAIFGPVISRLPADDAEAVALFEHVVWLTRYDNFAELKRHRTVPLDLERVRYWERRRRRRARR